jgi:hypothetical protein
MVSYQWRQVIQERLFGGFGWKVNMLQSELRIWRDFLRDVIDAINVEGVASDCIVI